jgi:hypothetical protein
MKYDLNLAFAYACALGLLGYVASWLLPRAIQSIVAAVVQLWRTLRAQRVDKRPPAAPRESPPGDWWGPAHHSQ